MCSDHAREIRLALKDPHRLCSALGLLQHKHTRAGRNYVVCCPVHGDRTPSCSVRIAQDGTVAVKCFGCDLAGDALHLVAAVHSLDLSANFKEVLLAAAEIAGLHTVIDEINGKAPYQKRELPPVQELPPERSYPPAGEVRELWTGACSVENESSVKRQLETRALPPHDVARLELARAITANQPLPRWATYQGNTWRFAGYRLIVPMFDPDGEMRSVRAWRVEDSDGPKRLPPAGCKANGLVMANGWALTLLRKKCGPRRVLVVEGEPDALSATIRWPGTPVFGLVSGSWGPEFAERIPLGSEVVVMTHHDPAGDKYAEIVKATVKSRAHVIRSAA